MGVFGVALEVQEDKNADVRKADSGYVTKTRCAFADLAALVNTDATTGLPAWRNDYSYAPYSPHTNVFVFQCASKAAPGDAPDNKRFLALGRFEVTLGSTPDLLRLRPPGPKPHRSRRWRR